MNPKQERQLLARAQRRFAQAAKGRPLWVYELSAWVVLAAAVAGGIAVVGGPILRAAVAVAIGFLAGLVVTVLLLKRMGMLQWQAIAPFVDHAALGARIEQLGPNDSSRRRVAT